MMLGSAKKSPEQVQALDRVKEWTRERFQLPQEAVIVVSEVACSTPGCPPLETVTTFWTADDRRYHFKLFKPVMEVIYEDLPFNWLMDTLADDEECDEDCC